MHHFGRGGPGKTLDIDVPFQGASWQRCQTHFIRNLLDACPKAAKEEFHSRLRLVFDVPDLKTARCLRDELVRDDASRAPKAVERLEEGFEDAMAVMAFPTKSCQWLRTPNGVERLNEAIRRRERGIHIFPNDASARRLIGAVCMEIDEAWMIGHRYFDMTEY